MPKIWLSTECVRTVCECGWLTRTERFLYERGRINIHGLGFLEFQKPCKISRIAHYRILFYEMHRTNRLNFGSKEREVSWPPYSELCQAFHHNRYEAAKILLGDAHDAVNMRSTAMKGPRPDSRIVYIDGALIYSMLVMLS